MPLKFRNVFWFYVTLLEPHGGSLLRLNFDRNFSTRRVSVLAIAVTIASASAGWAETVNRLVTLQGIRSATVAPAGLAFASLGLTSRRDALGDFFDEADGSIVLGFGLGDATETVGVQISASITSLTDSFGDSGSLSIKASRQINGLEVPTFVGLSFDRLAGWGDGKLIDESTTLSVTMFPTTQIAGQTYPLMITAGYGNAVLDHHREPGAFVGAGIGITENFGASLAWTGESVTLGTAFKFDALENLRFSASLEDAFDQVGGQRLTLSATYYFDTDFGR